MNKDALIKEQMYLERPMVGGYPNLKGLSPKKKNTSARNSEQEMYRFQKLSTYIDRLVGLDASKRIMVLGCGPLPYLAKAFGEAKHEVTAIDPIEEFVQSAAGYVDGYARVLQGVAERIPLPDSSQDIVLFPAVLEHVDSISKSLDEIFRVLTPGGILYLTTTNRFRFSVTGKNGEYRIPFYNWFPRLVKEGYIFSHLHYRPELANYSSRPEVHWLTYSELCALGRAAGFSGFYSHIDLMRLHDSWIGNSAIRRMTLPRVQQNAWLRALALLQVGGTIFMHKRAENLSS